MTTTNELYLYTGTEQVISDVRNAVSISPFRNEFGRRLAIARALYYQRIQHQGDALFLLSASHPNDAPGNVPNETYLTTLLIGKEQLDKSPSSMAVCPGDVHINPYTGRPDPISLSLTGVNKLKEWGVPAARIFGDGLNRKYKGSEGVYNTADEIFVAASLLNDEFKLLANDKTNQVRFNEIVWIVPRIQYLRGILHAAWMGNIPRVITFDNEPTTAQRLKEKILVAYTLLLDPDWQSSKSLMGNLARKERKPNK